MLNNIINIMCSNNTHLFVSYKPLQSRSEIIRNKKQEGFKPMTQNLIESALILQELHNIIVIHYNIPNKNDLLYLDEKEKDDINDDIIQDMLDKDFANKKIINYSTELAWCQNQYNYKQKMLSQDIRNKIINNISKAQNYIDEMQTIERYRHNFDDICYTDITQKLCNIGSSVKAILHKIKLLVLLTEEIKHEFLYENNNVRPLNMVLARIQAIETTIYSIIYRMLFSRLKSFKKRLMSMGLIPVCFNKIKYLYNNIFVLSHQNNPYIALILYVDSKYYLLFINDNRSYIYPLLIKKHKAPNFFASILISLPKMIPSNTLKRMNFQNWQDELLIIMSAQSENKPAYYNKDFIINNNKKDLIFITFYSRCLSNFDIYLSEINSSEIYPRFSYIYKNHNVFFTINSTCITYKIIFRIASSNKSSNIIIYSIEGTNISVNICSLSKKITVCVNREVISQSKIGKDKVVEASKNAEELYNKQVKQGLISSLICEEKKPYLCDKQEKCKIDTKLSITQQH